jgi:predicted dehydrogenase
VREITTIALYSIHALEANSFSLAATGGIARTFTKDLLIAPSTRDVHDIKHTVTAAASSSSKSSAEKFVSETVTPKQSSPSCTAYGSYAELVKDPNVDIIYVATPHSHHFQNCMLCLEAGKPILCEKAFTVNAEQTKILYKSAKAKNLFLMEAVWTRYFPLSIAVRKHITSGDIGEALRASADLSIGKIPEDEFDVSNRMVNKELAGGCLLDLGIYSLTWVFQTMWHTLSKDLQKEKPVVVGTAMTAEPRTGADEMTTILLEFPKSTPSGLTKAQAVATTAMRVTFDPDGNNTAGPAVRVQGTKGELQVFGPIYRPTRYRLIPQKGEIKDEHFEFPGGGHGMFWEADEAARCWRDAKLESAGMTWDESTLIMEVMDMARRQGGLAYPDTIESTKFPIELHSK